LNKDSLVDYNANASFLLMANDKALKISYKKKQKKSSDIEDMMLLPAVADFKLTYKGKIFKSMSDFKKVGYRELKYDIVLVKHGVPNDKLLIFNTPFTFSLDSEKESLELNRLGFLSSSILEHPYFVASVIRSISISMVNADESNDEEILTTIKAGIHPIIDRLKNSLSQYSVIKDLRIAESINMHRDSGKRKTTVSNLYLEYFVNGDWLPFSALSDGTKRVFYIIAEVLASYVDTYHVVNKSLVDNAFTVDYPKIIIIEEPELGIHPHQLHDLLNFLNDQSKEHQIIITTHSPQSLDILDREELDRLIICSYNKEKGTEFLRLDEKEKAKALKYMDRSYLSDYWRMSDLEKNDEWL
jgi:hypothetical protein